MGEADLFLKNMYVEVEPDFIEFVPMYCSDAIYDREALIRACIAELTRAGVEFDTLAGQGISGTLIVPELATRLGKRFVIVRKPDDTDHHAGGRVVGMIGKQWIFVDDLIDMGSTLDRVRKEIEKVCREYKFQSEYLGSLVYHHGTRFTPVELE